MSIIYIPYSYSSSLYIAKQNKQKKTISFNYKIYDLLKKKITRKKYMFWFMKFVSANREQIIFIMYFLCAKNVQK